MELLFELFKNIKNLLFFSAEYIENEIFLFIVTLGLVQGVRFSTRITIRFRYTIYMLGVV